MKLKMLNKLAPLLLLLLLIIEAPVSKLIQATTSTAATSSSNSLQQQQQLQLLSDKVIPPSVNLNKLIKFPSKSSSSSSSLSHHHHHQLRISDLISRHYNETSRAAISDTTAVEQPLNLKKNLFEKICIGTSNKLLLLTKNKTEHYLSLVERYRDCTYVIGNLEITWLADDPAAERPLDMSFLESIREITGYLLIARVNVEKISMPNLQIIRGRDLVAVRRNCETEKCDDNKEKDELAILLLYNEIKSLELPNLREILAGGVGSLDNKNLCYLRQINWEEILNPPYKAIFRYFNINGPPECPACDMSCQGSCWAEGPRMCQKLSKTNCAPSCHNRCFGTAPHECCHPFCAGGCTGPKATDCLACKNFYNDGECIQECPPMQRYNTNSFQWDQNPNGKYAYGASCVKKCPDYLLPHNGACVRTCPTNKRNANGECLSCSGPGPRPRECDVISQSGNTGATTVDDATASIRYVNCSSLIESSISDPTFTGFADILLNGGDGKLACNPAPEMSPLFPVSPQLVSSSSSSTSLNSDHTSSLNPSAGGDQSNSFTDSNAQTNTSSSSQQSAETAAAAAASKDPFANCKAIINSTAQLHATPDPSQCLKLEEPCPDGYFQELFASTGRLICRRCHHRCRRCNGMGVHVSACECAGYVVGEQCEDFCPRDYYTDEKSRHCGRCSPECNGCSGPTEADCHSCRVYRVYSQPQNSNDFVSSSSSSIETSNNILADNGIVDQQHRRLPFNCTSQCPPDRPYRVSDGNLPDLYCSELPDIGNGDAALLAARNPTQALVGLGTWMILFCVILSGVAICFWVQRLESEKDKTVKLTMHLSGIDDVEPLNPSNLKPNLAPLRSIKETELRKGNELGSGFGGTVYQGLWYPEGREHKNPRPVAIKVLRDNGQSNMNKKFLDEAYIMASVNHPNLVQLLAVCMTPKHLMLVTPLMPLGCLLEHVKKHKHDISAKNLLEWNKQIAKGMAYLEEHRMVHRDLALRNVLLRTCGRAMISDFGLAKFLEIDQSEYHSLGGRLPVKWLAPECIRERRFTHKSDVWAFGVTVWELLTFGKKPFEEYNTWKDMLTAIENGARLEQPPYLTTEVYSLMLSCWFYKPEARPSFRQLTQDFVKFAQDPLRYVAIGAKGIDYNPSSPLVDSPGGKFSRFTPSKSAQQHHHNHHNQRHNTELDSDQDEYSADSDLDQSQASSSLAGDEPQESPNHHHHHHHHHPQLVATSELTPSTHNRINETIRFGFDFSRRNHHHHHQHHGHHQHRHASLSESSDTLKTPTTPLKRMHFATDQQLIEEVDYDDIDVFKSAQQANKKQQQLDSNNNNIITVSASTDDTWQSLSRLRKGSTATEPPTDMYDYLLPSPCTEGGTHDFSQLYATTGDLAFDEVDASKQQLPELDTNTSKQQQQQQPSIRPTSQTGGARCGGGGGSLSHQHHHLSTSMIGVNNYEYFVTRTSSQYHLANGNSNQQQQHYADMDPSSATAAVAVAAAAAAAAAANRQQLEHSQQHLSTSNGNIPHSLV